MLNVFVKLWFNYFGFYVFYNYLLLVIMFVFVYTFVRNVSLVEVRGEVNFYWDMVLVEERLFES